MTIKVPSNSEHPQSGVLRSECADRRQHNSISLTREDQPCADDFNSGFRLEVGDPLKPTDEIPGTTRRRHGDLPFLALTGRGAEPLRQYGVGPRSEHIGSRGMSGYPYFHPEEKRERPMSLKGEA